MGALVIGKMVPCTCPCTASWQIHGHGDRQKKYKNELLSQEISDSICIYTRFRDEEEKTEEVYIFSYHYVLKDKNPIQICPIYMYITQLN